MAVKTVWVALTEREDDIPPIPLAVGTRDQCMDLLERRMKRSIDAASRKQLGVPHPAWIKVSDRCVVLAEQHDAGISYGTAVRVRLLK